MQNAGGVHKIIFVLRLAGNAVFCRYNCQSDCGLSSLRPCHDDVPKQICVDIRGNDTLLI